MKRFARAVVRHPRKIIAIWCLLALGGAYLALNLESRLQNGGYSVAGSQSARAVTLGTKRFHDKAQAQSYISLISRDQSLATLLRDADRLVRSAKSVPGVVSTGTPEISRSQHAVILPVNLHGSVGQAQKYVPSLERAIRRVDVRPVKAALIGQVPVYDRYLVDAKNGLIKSALISFPVTLIILLVAFLSIAAATLPLIVAAGSLSVTFGLLYALSFGTQLSVFVDDTVLILGLGLSIDFALFMVTRVREALADGAPNVADAVTQALCTTGRAILISGVTVAASLCGLLLAGVGFLGSLAAGAIGATLLALAAALTLAPAALVVLDGRLERLPIRSAASAIRSRLFWQTLAEAVVRRRLPIVCLLVPVLIALSLPALGLNVKFRTFGMLPNDDPVRRSTNEVERAFGPGFGAPVTILAKTSAAHLEAVAERERGIAQIGVAQSGSGGWRRLSAILRAAPDTDHAEDLMHGLRARLPTLLGRDTLVGGPTAEAADLADRINTRTPVVAIAIMLAEIAFLTAAFRAPVLAVKAALTTLLSVTATLGILSLLFGGSDALAYFVPLLLVATLFGLSTDYEVFLLSRVREQHDAGDDNVTSVQTALVRSARSITLAGITMSVVFFAFASSPLLAFRQLGVGMGLAVLLDVTVVRGLVVPATVALLGELNWWRPRLRRRRPADSIAT